MANLKSLKLRIKSVKSTQKITKAMKMVAASKLRRAQEKAEAARPYTERMERMLTTLAAKVNPDNAPALLSGRRDDEGNISDKTHLIIVATSDRGLCGGFNSSIAKAARNKAIELQNKGKKVKMITVGKKGYDQLKSLFKDNIIERIDTSAQKQPAYPFAGELTDKIIKLFEAGEIDSCSIVYNKFVSILVQKVTFQQLIPLGIPELTKANDNKSENAEASYEYEPSEEKILTDLLPRNIAIQVFHALLENAASVQGARMSAMDNATRNAGEMIKDLTLVYNRTRQAAITKELIEIISGAEAL